MEKAKELASLPHPFYAKTKQTAQKERRKKIGDAIKKHVETKINNALDEIDRLKSVRKLNLESGFI